MEFVHVILAEMRVETTADGGVETFDIGRWWEQMNPAALANLCTGLTQDCHQHIWETEGSKQSRQAGSFLFWETPAGGGIGKRIGFHHAGGSFEEDGDLDNRAPGTV